MKLTAIDAIQKGFQNVRANWELVVIQAIHTVIVGLLIVAGLVPIVLAIGVGLVRSIWAGGNLQVGRVPDMEPMLERFAGNLPAFLLALLGAFAIWTIAFLVSCYFQAGILGQLADGESRAAAGAGYKAGWRDFRVFKLSGFRARASQGVWKFFWMINIFMIIWSFIALGLTLVAAGGVQAMVSGGSLRGIWLLGCSAVLFLAPVAILLAAWSQMSKAELVCSKAGVLVSLRRAFGVTLRRLGAVLLTMLIGLIAGVAVSMVFFPVSLVADIAMGDNWTAQITADLLIMLIQSAVAGAVGLAITAIFVSLAFWEGEARHHLSVPAKAAAGSGNVPGLEA